MNPDDRSRHRVFEQAVKLLAVRGLDRTRSGLVDEAADGAEVARETARLFFPRDADLVVALHERLATHFEMRVADLPTGTIGARFAAAMTMRLADMAPYKAALRGLMAELFDPQGEHGVLSKQTDTVRARVRCVFDVVVSGASDAPADTAHRQSLGRAIYALHLALVLLWTQDDGRATPAAIELSRDLLSMAAPLTATPMLGGLVGRLEGVLSQWIEPPPDAEATAVAERILGRLFVHRRLLGSAGECATAPCDTCLAVHLSRVRRFVAAGQPVHLVLPAFPAKSPSPQKTLGPRPDMAEEVALRFLGDVCAEIAEVYEHGARVTICSDGRVFGDLVNVGDGDITRYGEDIDVMIARLGIDTIDTFSTDDLLLSTDYDAMRAHIDAHYAEPLEVVEQRARDHAHHRSMWNGMQRFLFEDRAATETELSRTKLRKLCGEIAHRVVQRSNAWTRVVAQCFPTALRLSIHPQPAHSDKIGIRLGVHEDIWLTPWHGVALQRDDGFELMPRHVAEALGAHVVERDGRPSHYRLAEGATER